MCLLCRTDSETSVCTHDPRQCISIKTISGMERCPPQTSCFLWDLLGVLVPNFPGGNQRTQIWNKNKHTSRFACSSHTHTIKVGRGSRGNSLLIGWHQLNVKTDKCELGLTFRSCYMNCLSTCFRTHNSSRQSDSGCKTDDTLFSMLHFIFSMICFDVQQPRPVIKEKCQHINAKRDLCMMPCSWLSNMVFSVETLYDNNIKAERIIWVFYICVCVCVWELQKKQEKWEISVYLSSSHFNLWPSFRCDKQSTLYCDFN